MAYVNVEIKAKCSNQQFIRDILKSRNADFKGVDHQIDTYFNIKVGRLKLRECDVDNRLIYYDREDKEGPKQSNISLFKFDPKSSLKAILTNSLGVLVVVDKQREIYFIDNVEFHIDTVKQLGNFVEIEAIGNAENADKQNSSTEFSNYILRNAASCGVLNSKCNKEKLLKQCQFFLDLFKISQKDLISVSYSDLLLQK